MGQLKAWVMETGGWGGLHYYAHFLCNALSSFPLDLAMLTGEEYELEERPRAFNRIRIFRRETYFLTLARLSRLFFSGRPNLLHIHSLISPRKDLLLLLLCRLVGLRVVLTVHNILPHDAVPGAGTIQALLPHGGCSHPPL